MRRAAFSLVLAPLLAGCSLLGGDGVFDVSTDGAAISVQNVSDQTVSYVAIES